MPKAVMMDAPVEADLWARLDAAVDALRKDMTEAKGQLDVFQIASDVRNMIRGFVELGKHFRDSLHDSHLHQKRLKTEVASLQDELRRVRDSPAGNLRRRSAKTWSEEVGGRIAQKDIDSQPVRKLADLCGLQGPCKFGIQVLQRNADECSESSFGKNGRGKTTVVQPTLSGPLTQLLLSLQTNAWNDPKAKLRSSSKPSRSGREADEESAQTGSGQDVRNDRNGTEAIPSTFALKEKALQLDAYPAMASNAVEGASCHAIGDLRRPNGVHSVADDGKDIEIVLTGVKNITPRAHRKSYPKQLVAVSQRRIQTRGSCKRLAQFAGLKIDSDDSRRCRLRSGSRL